MKDNMPDVDGDMHEAEDTTLAGHTQAVDSDGNKQEPSQTDEAEEASNVSDMAPKNAGEKSGGNWYSKTGPATPAHSLPALSDVVGVSEIADSQTPDHERVHISEDQNVFDPEVHVADQWGEPVLNKDGSYRKKRGRKKGSRNSDSDSTDENTVPVINVDEAAKQSANLFINAGVLIFGDDWAPESKDEAGALKNAFKNYYDAKGVPEIPPEYGLAFALGAYSLNRITKDQTRTKLQKVGIFLKEKFGRFFRRNKSGV